jgi:hypothetical protein
MDHLIAKLKGQQETLLKVISDNEIFAAPTDLNNVFLYAPGDVLEENEWFCIDNFSQQNYCPDFLKKSFTSTDLAQIKPNQYTEVEYVCSIQEEKYFFQKMAAKTVLRKKHVLLSQEPVMVQASPMLILNQDADAIYDKAINRLYFKALPIISGIFKGVDVLYREATITETTAFLKKPFVSLANGYTAAQVKTMNRKRIALATEAWDSFSSADKKAIIPYIKGYCPQLTFNSAKKNFTVSSEEELKSLLYGLLERYYTTPHGGRKRLASAVRDL